MYLKLFDANSDVIDELCIEQQQDKPPVHQLKDKTAKVSGVAPAPSAQYSKKEPETAEGADYAREEAASVPIEVGVIGQ